MRVRWDAEVERVVVGLVLAMLAGDRDAFDRLLETLDPVVLAAGWCTPLLQSDCAVASPADVERLYRQRAMELAAEG